MPEMAPSDLSYPQPPAFTVNNAITPLTPTVTGRVNRYDVSPALPQGLTLNISTGVISGTPIALAPKASYVISAANTGGMTTTTVTLQVNNIPPTLLYRSAYYGYTAGVPGQTIQPTLGGGAVVGWSVSPALPAGLTLNSDGSISGSPTVASPAAPYMVTASNSGGPGSFMLTIAVAAAPLLKLGLSAPVSLVRYVNSSVLSQDQNWNWLLEDYASGAFLATGIGGSGATVLPGSYVDLEGSVMIDSSFAQLEIRSATTGSVLATIPAPSGVQWWRLATDDSYVAAGSATALSVWAAPSGQLLFTHAGNYSQASAFAAPGQIQIALGAAGTSVIETVAVPAGTSTVSPAYQGSFCCWFSDGARFLTTLGSTTVWTYSAAAVQQDITSVTTTSGLAGEGVWFWIFDQSDYTLDIYKVGNSATPAFSQQFPVLNSVASSGSTLAVLGYAADPAPGATPLTVIDLSGATPSPASYSVPFVQLSGFGAISATQWIVGDYEGVLYDGTSPAGSPRTLTLGAARSVVAGTTYISVATASGQIFFFNASDDSLVGQIPFSSQLLATSTDGTVLAARAYNGDFLLTTDDTLNVYDLPSTTPVDSFPYSSPNTILTYLTLSGTGTEIGELFPGNSPSACATQVITLGGSVVLCNSTASDVALSPDGTLIATSPAPSPTVTTSIYKNGTLATAVAGAAVGWIDNNHLLVQSYIQNMQTSGNVVPMGTAIYDVLDNMQAATPLAVVGLFQPVSGMEIYETQSNVIVSLQSGATLWASGNALDYEYLGLGIGGTGAPGGGITPTQVVFASGAQVLAQPYN
jgi:hypothetical protein